MENIISIANCWEKVEIGYVSTHVKMNRVTNEILSVTYHWYEDFSINNTKIFNSFESLNTFINELIDLKNGGFSQKRPLSNIKRDQLIYVKMCKEGEWNMRYFSHFNDNGLVSCFNDQKKSINGDCTSTWNFYSIENPLL